MPDGDRTSGGRPEVHVTAGRTPVNALHGAARKISPIAATAAQLD